MRSNNTRSLRPLSPEGLSVTMGSVARAMCSRLPVVNGTDERNRIVLPLSSSS